MPQTFSNRMKMGTRKRKPQDFLSNGGPSPLKRLVDAGASALFDVRQIDGVQIPALEPRTLPNGVRNGLYTQKVSFDVIITSNRVATVINRVNYTQAFVEMNVFNPATVTFISAIQGVIKVEGWTEKADSTTGSYVPNLFSTRADGSFVFDVPLGTTLAQAQALIGGTVIRYQLATPIDRLNSPLPLTKFDTSVVLPNGVRNSEYVKRVSDEVTILSAWLGNILTTYPGVDFIRVVGSFENQLSWETTLDGMSFIENMQEITGSTLNTLTTLDKYYSTTNQLWLPIPKGESLADAKDRYAGTKIRYQLATPIDLTALTAKTVYKDLANGVGENLFDDKILDLANDGTNYVVSNNSLKPKGYAIITPALFLDALKKLLKPNTIYTLSYKVQGSGAMTGIYGSFTTNTPIWKEIVTSGLGVRTGTFNSNDILNATSVLFYGSTTAGAEVAYSDFMLTEGSVAKPYKPYIPHSAVLANSANTATDGLVLLPIKSAKGRKIRYRNEVVNPLFWDTNGDNTPDGWSSAFNTKSVLNNTFIGTANAAGQNITLIGVTRTVGKRYFYRIEVKSSSNLVRINNGLSLHPHSGSGKFESICYLTASNTVSSPHYGLYDDRTSAWDQIQAMNPLGFCLDDNADILAIEAELGRQFTAAEVNELFDFTADEGEVSIALMPFRKFDGTDTFMSVGTEAFDPVGDEDFAVGFVLRLPAFAAQYLIARNAGTSGNTTDQQASLYLNSAGILFLEYAGTSRAVMSLTTEHLNTALKFVFGRFDGKLKFYLNGSLVYTLDSDLPIVSNAFLRLFTTANGASHQFFSNAFSAVTLLCAPHRPIDEEALIDAFDAYVSDYFPTPRAVKDADCVLYLDPRYEGEALRTASLEARTLPNGVANGPWTQRVSEDLILNESLAYSASDTAHPVTMRFTIPLPLGLAGGDGVTTMGAFIPTGTSSLDYENMQMISSNLFIRINRSKLVTQDVNGLLAYLKQNPVIIRYQLATPIDRLNNPLPLTKFDTSVMLPNGVRNSEYVKRISDERTLTRADFSFNYTATNVQVLTFLVSSTIFTNIAFTPSAYFTKDMDFIFGDYPAIDSVANIGKVAFPNTNDRIRFIFPLNTFPTDESARVWLDTHPIKIRYQLATPIDNFNIPVRRGLIDLSAETGKNLFDVRDFVARANNANIKIERVDGRDVLAMTGESSIIGKQMFPSSFRFKENTQYSFKAIVKAPSASLGGIFYVRYTDGTSSAYPLSSTLTAWTSVSYVSVAGKTIESITTTFGNTGVIQYYDLATLSITEGAAVPDYYLPPAKASALPIGFANTQTDGLTKRAVRSKKGMPFTYENLAANGDFAEGTAYWQGNACIISAVAGILSSTSNGVASGPNVMKSGAIPVKENERYYVKSTKRITTPNCLSMAMYFYSSGATTQYVPHIINPVINQWYTQSGIITIPTDMNNKNANLYILHQYADAATANGKIMEVKEVQAINLTDNPFVQAVEAKLGRQLTVEECDQIFDFTRSSKTVKVALQDFIKLDGVDSRFSLSHPKLNIRGLEGFVMAAVFMTPAVLKDGYIFSQNTLSGSDVAYGLYLYAADKKVILYAAGSGIGSVFVNPNSSYRLITGRVNGKVVFICNEIPVSEWNGSSTSGFITPGSFTMVGARSGAADGSMISVLSDVYLGPLLLFKGADLKTGLSGIMNRIESVFEGYTPDEPIDETDVLGVKWGKVASPTLTRTDGALGKVAVVNGQNDFASHPIFKLIREVTDSYGNVFVRFPKFYIKKTSVPGELTKQISLTKRPGYYLPWCFYDFQTRRELPYFDIGKHLGSVSEDGLRLESKGGRFPANNKNIVQFRDLAKANGQGYQQLDVHGVDVLQTLFYMMFATLHSQSIMKGYTEGQYASMHVAVVAGTGVNQIVIANAFADGFRVGQAISIGATLGGQNVMTNRLITAINVYDASSKALVFDGVPVNIAIGNIVYNVGYKTGWSASLQTGWKEANDGKSPCVFLGVESLYGDIWQFVDGININDRQSWVCKNAENYASNLFAAPYEQLDYLNANNNGYITEIGFDTNFQFAEIPKSAGGGNSVTFYSDYCAQVTGQRTAMFGSPWYYGPDAGISSFNLGGSSSSVGLTFGARLCRKPTPTSLSKPEDIQSYLDDASCKMALSVDRQVAAVQNANGPLQSPLVDVAGKAGKNLFDPVMAQVGGVDGTNFTLSAISTNRRTNKIKCIPNQQYTVSGGDRNIWRFELENGTLISGAGTATITTPSNASYLICYYSTTGTHQNIQLELGAVATAYEPYGFNNALLQGFSATAASGYSRRAVKAASGGDLVEYENLVVNGDGSSLTNWITHSDYSTLSLNAGKVRATRNTNRPYVGQLLPVTAKVGERVYARFKINGNKTGDVRLYFCSSGIGAQDSGFIPTFSIGTSVIEKSGLTTMGIAANYFAIDGLTFTTAGDYLEVDDVLIFNLSTNPYVLALEAKLGRQLTAEECDILFSFTATKASIFVKTPYFLKFDGTKDYGMIQNVPDVDIVGTHDFAISTVFVTPATWQNGYLIVKTDDGAEINRQYSLTLISTGAVEAYIGGIGYTVAPAGTILANTSYEIIFMRVGGFRKCYVNGILVTNVANVVNISASKLNVRIGARPTNINGLTHDTFLNGYLASLAIFYNGAAGLDLTKVEKAVAKLNEPYL